MARRFRRLALGAAVLGALAWGVPYYADADSDALWRIISQQCVPGQQQGNPSPCAEVDRAHDSAVLKSREGALQYLLLPLRKVEGIESPQLLLPDAPAYWRQAWQARRFLDQKRGQALPPQAVSLTINSRLGRSQNQLHIHISCVDPTVRQQIDDVADSLPRSWRELPMELKKHGYWARRVDADAAGDPQGDPFRLLADELPDARDDMGSYGMALLPAKFADGDGFVLLATRANLLRGNRASAEELQDHDCKVLPR
ncbi:CDP-diacylglycerol diphosphatase [Chromobacterium sp. IIBBL 290-4]|uniref:CDP-diacylglycerol diphosphatase n=1 Tax=Chromobacterium sp. IIBBL 290-4 TaxID=2953890 RepID=UPI0020B75B64|nr:CDP-diacylglycerol diphosphatase [Chromobacterium sp. IIBBL 290-4]UTH75536.1 CDP-diacylglycerol diphosphatase [Chromobacterium sp. IIBBL 290-4]